MITFKAIGSYGRFGNQMFQYATLYSIAKTKKLNFGVPYGYRSNNEYNDFCLKDCFPNLSALDCTDIEPINYAEERNFEYNAGIFGIPDNTDIRGYFQSEKYFKDYRNGLLKEFEFNNDIHEKASYIRSLTNKDAISIHIRLGDYIYQQDRHPVCPLEYYEEALSHVPDDILIFVFSDNTEKAFEYFSKLNRKITYPETNDKYTDMCIMSMCDYHIIANSSFSWWGSWLSESKKTIAPSRWFGDADHMPKNWSDIYCKDWIVI
jgi:hypothetical protein